MRKTAYLPVVGTRWLSSMVQGAGMSNESIAEGGTTTNSSVRFGTYETRSQIASLPFDIRESLLTECYEVGLSSLAQRYFESVASQEDGRWYLADMMQGIFAYAIRKKKHQLAYNILVVLSQLPYEWLGDWACLMAVSATRSPDLDVVELGIRCFECWEDKAACEFLNGCSFGETWLQGYADEVCEYVMGMTAGEGEELVLPKEDFAWQVAQGGRNSTSFAEGRQSRHGSVGTKDGEQQAFRMAG